MLLKRIKIESGNVLAPKSHPLRRRKFYIRLQKRTHRLMSYRRLLWESVQALRLEPGLKVLNLSGGRLFENFLVEKNLETAHIASVTPYEQSAFFANGRERLPFESACFDRVFVGAPLGELNRIFFINELKRVLKQSGRAVFVSEAAGLTGAVGQARDHFKRIGHIHSPTGRAAAFLRLVFAVPALLIEGLLNRSIDRQPLLNKVLSDNGLALTAYPDEIGNVVLAARVEAEVVADPVIENFVAYAKGFDLQYPTISPGGEHLVNVTLNDLKRDPVFLDQLAESYQEIFGSSEVWAEGAYCSLNPRHLISWEEYTSRFAIGDLRCLCGGDYIPCYSKDYFKRLITDQLTETPAYNPFCSLYIDDGRVTGFMWGAVAPADAIVDRIMNIPAWVDKAEWRTFVADFRTQWFEKFNIDGSERIFYIYDLGILTRSRRGIEPMMLLSGQAFAHAVANECQKALCWTSIQAPLYKIIKYCAFEEVSANAAGIVFMFCRNIVPALQILQHDPRSMLPIMVKNARLDSTRFSAKS